VSSVGEGVETLERHLRWLPMQSKLHDWPCGGSGKKIVCGIGATGERECASEQEGIRERRRMEEKQKCWTARKESVRKAKAKSREEWLNSPDNFVDCNLEEECIVGKVVVVTSASVSMTNMLRLFSLSEL
jgi:hypothetical protein